MIMNKKFSAAAYRKNKGKRPAKTYEFTAPSGAEFLLQKPSMTAFLASGQLPSSFVEKLLSMENKTVGEIDELMTALSAEEKVANLQFLGAIVKGTCVSPKIVKTPTADDELQIEDLDDEDLVAIFQFGIAQAGSQAEALNSFRKK